MLNDFKQSSTPMFQNNSARVWDIGDGVVNIEFCSKQNALDQQSFDGIDFGLDLLEKNSAKWQAMTLYSDATNFAAGANLIEFRALAKARDWARLAKYTQRGQDTHQRMRLAKSPIVSAVGGAALGGSCELILNSSAAVLHTQIKIGLVEVGVGIIPAWGGCVELLYRYLAPCSNESERCDALLKTFKLIGGSSVVSSPEEAKALKFLRPDDLVTDDRSCLLALAKEQALNLVAGFTTASAREFELRSSVGRVTLANHLRTLLGQGGEGCSSEGIPPHSFTILERLAETLTMPASNSAVMIDESAVLASEVSTALALFKTDATLARIEAILQGGKPLKN